MPERERSRRRWSRRTRKSRRHWLQIIHDREHSLPRELDPWMTVYDEIRQNILARWKRKG